MREKYLLDSFTVLMNRWSLFGGTDKVMENITLFIANLFFGLTKLFYSMLDATLFVIGQIDVLATGSSVAFSFATGLYNKLFELFSVPVFLLGAMYYFWQFFTSSVKNANRFALTFLMVLTLNVGFYSKGADLMNQTQSVFNVVEKGILENATSFVEDNIKGSVTDKSTTDILRAYLFRELVADMYMAVNFGEVHFDEEKVKPYLITADTSDTVTAVKNMHKKADENSVEPYFQSYKGIEKIFIAFFSVFKAIYVGGILVLILLLKVLIQFILLLMVYFLPIFSILAFIPRLNHMLFRYLVQGLTLFSVSPFVSLLTLVLFFIFQVMDNTLYATLKGRDIDESAAVFLLLSIVLKMIFLIVLWKTRRQVFSLLSTGNFIHTTMPVYHANFRRYSDSDVYNDRFADEAITQVLSKIEKKLDELITVMDKPEQARIEAEKAESRDFINRDYPNSSYDKSMPHSPSPSSYVDEQAERHLTKRTEHTVNHYNEPKESDYTGDYHKVKTAFEDELEKLREKQKKQRQE